MWQYFKSLKQSETLYFAVVLCVVAITSFGLGRQSVQSAAPAAVSGGVTLIASSSVSSSSMARVAEQGTTTGPIVASKNGTKYYLTSCASANRIADKNKVYFASVSAAVAAGLTPAANCPGLSN